MPEKASIESVADDFSDQAFKPDQMAGVNSRLARSLLRILSTLHEIDDQIDVAIYLFDLSGQTFRLSSSFGEFPWPEVFSDVDVRVKADDKPSLVERVAARLGFGSDDSADVHPLCDNHDDSPVLLRGFLIGVGISTGARRSLVRMAADQALQLLRNFQLQSRLATALAAQEHFERQRERLHLVVHAALTSPTVAECVKRIVDLAPSALGAHYCTIFFTTERKGFLQGAATNNPAAQHFVGNVLDLNDYHPGKAIELGQPLWTDEMSMDPRVHPDLRPKGKGMAAIILPLLPADGPAIGAMTIVRQNRGPLEEGFIRLCTSFANQATRAIENTRLIERTTRDAETRLLLLRELNHRVKNSMAGIVALLRTDVPPLGQPGEEWLARIVQRIHVMARGHKLFDGYGMSVPLELLLQSAVESAEPRRPARSEVVIDIDPSAQAASFQSEKGVALAMVVHELCSNALAYGPQDGAEVRITARCDPDALLTIEVENTVNPIAGGGNGNWASTRLGLTLVQALVARELQGRFSTREVKGDLNIATIVFKHIQAVGG